MNGNVLNI